MNTTIENNIQQIEHLASQFAGENQDLIGAALTDVTRGQIVLHDRETDTVTSISVGSDNTVESVSVGISVSERDSRSTQRTLILEEGILSLEYGRGEPVKLYQSGEGFLPGIGEKRQKVASAYTVLMIRRLQDQLDK